MMESIPTAKEFLESRNFSDEELLDEDVAIEYLVAFGRMCAQAALKTAATNAKIITKYDTDMDAKYQAIDESSILNSYPIENIQ